MLLLGDGGTCRHFLTGLYFLEHMSLPASTYMSAVEPAAPWTTHELFCDLLFGIAFPLFALNWVVLVSTLAIAFSLLWSYQMARLRGATPLFAFTSFMLAFEVCSLHWSARPHLFSYLLFIACYYECFIAERSLKARLCIYSALIFIWGNLHGSYVLALLMPLARAFSDKLEKLACSHENSDRWSLKESAFLFGSGLLASSLNLRGAAFLTYVFGYLANPKIQAHSDEWRSIDFSLAGPVYSFLALFCLLVFLWVFSKQKPRLAEFLYMLFLFCSSLYAMRLMPYFAMAALPAMSLQLAEIAGRANVQAAPFFGKLVQADLRAAVSESKLSGKSWVFSLAAAVVSLVFLILPACKINDFDPERMPVRAADYLKEKGIAGLGFCKDNWGSYLYWRLAKPIFIDDKTDFYSQKILDDYMAIYFNSPLWQESLERYPFKYVLIPHGLPLEQNLNENKDWSRAYQDNHFVLFLKNHD